MFKSIEASIIIFLPEDDVKDLLKDLNATSHRLASIVAKNKEASNILIGIS